MNYVYSTLTADNEYSTTAGTVVIFGRLGAKQRGKIDTPAGVATQVDDNQITALESHPLFAKHVAAGHISVQKKELTASRVEKLVESDMAKGDKADQETTESLSKKTKAKKKDA